MFLSQLQKDKSIVKLIIYDVGVICYFSCVTINGWAETIDLTLLEDPISSQLRGWDGA